MPEFRPYLLEYEVWRLSSGRWRVQAFWQGSIFVRADRRWRWQARIIEYRLKRIGVRKRPY